jgi:exodeoxyribonuclease VII small subunit
MAKSTKKLRFEEALEKLDEIAGAIDSGEIGIEESITKYAEAMELANRCREILDRAEQRIEQIQQSAAGPPEAAPFDAASVTAEPADDADRED